MINIITRNLLTQKLARYAEVLSVDLKSDFSKLDLTILLKGDLSPTKITLGGLKISGSKFHASSVRSDKEWLHNLLVDNPKLLVFDLPDELKNKG